MTKYASHSFFKNLVIFVMVFFGIFISYASFATDENNVETQIDEFVAKAPGDELPKSVAQAKSAYRAKRVNKSLLRWIDRQGYYRSYLNDFTEWCQKNKGKIKKVNALFASCYSDDRHTQPIGGYEAEITTLAEYQGEMTAGYATFYFYGTLEMSLRDIQMQNDIQIAESEIKLKREELTRQNNCRKSLIDSLRTSPALGAKTTSGMVVDVKPPLVQVQVINRNPSAMWVEMNQLMPMSVSDYCSVSPK
jgi:hypothetical protein